MIHHLNIDEVMVNGLIAATNAGLQMASLTPEPMGISRVAASAHYISAVVGFVGNRSGTVTLNLSAKAAMFIAKAFSGTEHADLNEEVLDAVAEISNIIAGRTKAELAKSKYAIDHISCPSIIIGGDYRVYHFKGFDSASVEFNIPNMPSLLLVDRFFSVSIAASRT